MPGHNNEQDSATQPVHVTAAGVVRNDNVGRPLIRPRPIDPLMGKNTLDGNDPRSLPLTDEASRLLSAEARELTRLYVLSLYP